MNKRLNNSINAGKWALLLLSCALLSSCGDGPGGDAADADPLDVKGQWTFVNYWAEWCKPCIKEIPELNALNKMAEFRVLGVNFDGARGADLDAQLQVLGVEFPTLDEDPGKRFALERPQVLPTTLVLSPEGKLAKVLVGPQTRESLVQWTRQLADTQG